jgi:hypothetical protein
MLIMAIISLALGAGQYIKGPKAEPFIRRESKSYYRYARV